MKKKILFVYSSMIIGGSTTALLSILNSLDPEKYEVDLQLFRNEGSLMNLIPEHVTLLPEAEIYKGVKGRIIKTAKCVLTGHAFQALRRETLRTGKLAISRCVLGDFQAKELSRRNKKHYDYAIGFLGGWSDRYLAFCVNADRKYAWLHSLFTKITPDPDAERTWLERVDKVVFVSDACRDVFIKVLPQMAEKTITLENITDSEIIRSRSRMIDETDMDYQRFVESRDFKIITVCRLTVNVKGLDRIVKCAKVLKDQGFHFLWYIIGDGDDSEVLHDMIRHAGVEDCVLSIGARINPHPFIAAADIMCMPSRYEGKPVVITESMILGVPPVVTSYPSAGEQIENGVVGLIVDNDDDSIIEAVSSCIQNEVRMTTMRTILRMREYGTTKDFLKMETTLFS